MKRILIILALGLFVAGCSSESEDTGLTEVDDPEQNEAEANVENEESTNETSKEENESETAGSPVEIPTISKEIPEDTVAFIEQPEDIESDRSADEAPTAEQQLLWLWKRSGILPIKEDDIMDIAVKESARYATYNDYMALKEMGIESLNTRNKVDLGTINPILMESDMLIKSNEISYLDDIAQLYMVEVATISME